MLCEKPFVKDGKAFGCGQCLPCRVNRRRIWTHRLMLESLLHGECSFATLTYSDENLRNSSGALLSDVPEDLMCLPSLQPVELKNFLKRLRKAMRKRPIRFYACGEYGDATQRPHYHLALFGFPRCFRGRTKRSLRTGRVDWLGCCEPCRTLGNAWGLGDIELAPLEEGSAHYIAGYVTKKMTAADDDRLQGRHPEFARMSNRPGIGADALHEVAHTLMEHGLDELPDVPHALRHGKKMLPLGPYLTRRLRKLIGRDEKTPESTLEKAQEEMRSVREAAFEASESFSKALARSNDQRRRNFYARRNLKKEVKTI